MTLDQPCRNTTYPNIPVHAHSPDTNLTLSYYLSHSPTPYYTYSYFCFLQMYSPLTSPFLINSSILHSQSLFNDLQSLRLLIVIFNFFLYSPNHFLTNTWYTILHYISTWLAFYIFSWNLELRRQFSLIAIISLPWPLTLTCALMAIFYISYAFHIFIICI